jgi:hypothetical protein
MGEILLAEHFSNRPVANGHEVHISQSDRSEAERGQSRSQKRWLGQKAICAIPIQEQD